MTSVDKMKPFKKLLHFKDKISRTYFFSDDFFVRDHFILKKIKRSKKDLKG